MLARIVGIGLGLTIGIASVAGRQASSPTAAPETAPAPADKKPVPAAPKVEQQSEYSIYEQLTDDHRRRVDQAAKYYVRLDDGTCLNAFRLIRSIELREDEKRVRREEMLEALGALVETDTEPPKPGNQRVKHEKLPNWVEYKQYCYVFGPGRDMAGFGGNAIRAANQLEWLATGRAYNQGMIVSFGSYTNVYIAGMNMNFAVPRRLEETILLGPSGPAQEGQHPPLKVYQVVGRQPTPQQLAEYLVKNKRELIEYEIPKLVHHQPTKSRRVDRGRGWVENVSEPEGPPVHTYKWVEKKFPLRLNPKLEKKVVTQPTGE
ncbi:MAG: hypothetical protein K2W85_03120 [Phycisphaerales bacterium]|nr:hypothetical protein [Phycisphaerales bacterium]